LSDIYRKLGVRSRSEAVAVALRKGLIRQEPLGRCESCVQDDIAQALDTGGSCGVPEVSDMTPFSVAERRGQYIALAQRRVRPGSGSSSAHLRRRTAVQPLFDLRQLIRKTRYLLVGGLATRHYMPERMTLDTEILVLAEDQEAVEQELTAAGCQKLGMLAIGGSTWALPNGTTLDVVTSDAAWAREAIERPLQTEEGMPVIALPYLVLMKLYASRAQDIADITRMLGGADDLALAEVRSTVARHMPDTVNDVESMIVLGRLEYQP